MAGGRLPAKARPGLGLSRFSRSHAWVTSAADEPVAFASWGTRC